MFDDILCCILYYRQHILWSFQETTGEKGVSYLKMGSGTAMLETYDVLIPFDFKTEPSCPSSKYMVNLVSMETTYFVCGLLFAGVVEECVWDYAITITLIHIAVTSTECRATEVKLPVITITVLVQLLLDSSTIAGESGEHTAKQQFSWSFNFTKECFHCDSAYNARQNVLLLANKSRPMENSNTFLIVVAHQ
ncbi:transmembrane protein 244 [Stegostoma tigrinum]|uniref:transmembrane protein 244 n=1 Tax=Stegostoma tigrinum TaxID=3053191 RepID=UPI00202AE440|nr:transmembrane protein 244 [Stegostoma tigrinum]